MIALVDMQRIPGRGLFRRSIGIQRRVIDVLGLRCRLMTAAVPEHAPPRRQQRYADAVIAGLKEARVGHVAFSRDFTMYEAVLRAGFTELDETPIFESLAGEIADGAATRHVQVLFCTGFPTEPARQALRVLAEAFRTVLIAGDASGSLSRALAREMGVSAICDPSPALLRGTDAAVIYPGFTGRLQLPDGCVTIVAGDGIPDGITGGRPVSGVTIGLRDGVECTVPDGFDPQLLVAAALAAGTLRPGDVVIRKARFQTSELNASILTK